MPASPRTRREQGFAAYVLVMFIVLGVTFALSARGTFQSLLRDRPREKASLSALYAAQGGIEKARLALSRDGGWASGEVPVGRGSAAVTVRPAAGDPSLRDIVSLGTDPGAGNEITRARRRIAATVRLGKGLPVVVWWRED